MPQALELPEELIDAMDADPELADAFHAAHPGASERSYVIHLSSKKTPPMPVTRFMEPPK